MRPDVDMADEIAKTLLENAQTLAERVEAIQTALRLGMPLHQIEEFLDWLDACRSSSDSSERRK